MPAELVKTDILVIGAGPAGATTALTLAKLGVSHLIVDAAVFPRDKICGDCLDLKVIRVLRHLDPRIVENELIGNEFFTPSFGTRFFTQKGNKADFVNQPGTSTTPPYPLFFTAKRLCFDNFLVQKFDRRYTDFRQGTKVTKIFREGNGWRVQAKVISTDKEIEIITPLIIGADGDHSVLLRYLGERKIDRRHYAGTLRQYWRHVEGTDAQPDRSVFSAGLADVLLLCVSPGQWRSQCRLRYGKRGGRQRRIQTTRYFQTPDH